MDDHRAGSGSGGGGIPGPRDGAVAPLAARLAAACDALRALADEESSPPEAGSPEQRLRALAEDLVALLQQARLTSRVPEDCVTALLRAAERLQPLRDGVEPGLGGVPALAGQALEPLAQALAALSGADR